MSLVAVVAHDVDWSEEGQGTEGCREALPGPKMTAADVR